jgi:nitrate reductase cytochrome c-type subunit
LSEPTNHDDTAGACGRPAPEKKPACTRGLAFQLAALGLIVVSGLAGTGLARWLQTPHAVAPSILPPRLFADWEKPDLVLVVSGEQHGYLLPCGCSHPQKGGLERRYNLIEALQERGWPVAAVDLGDVPQIMAPAGLPNLQGLIKYRYAMKAMKAMGYTAIGIGEYEASMPLTKALDVYALNNEKPRVVCANLKDRDKYPDETKAWQLAEPIKGSDVKLGVTALVGPSVRDQIKKKDPSVDWIDSTPALNAVLKEMSAAKVDLPLLLYMGSISQGLPGSPAEALACAQAFPQFPLIMALDDTDEPRSDPLYATNPKTRAKTMLLSLGHKGKYVGVVGVFRTGKAAQPFELKYQLVEMGEEFMTPKGKEANQPILKLMEEYTAELKKEDYLDQYPQIPHPSQAAAKGKAPTYVGSDRCTDCHKAAKEVWEKTPHHNAYQTLVDAKQPSNRQYDPECIVCHTVGFGYKNGFTSAEKTAKLKNVGCESCHGPGSLHVNAPNNVDLQLSMNPWKAPAGETEVAKGRRIRRIDDACQKCHDPENDVNWSFERNWPKIAHPTPPEEKQDAAAEK